MLNLCAIAGSSTGQRATPRPSSKGHPGETGKKEKQKQKKAAEQQNSEPTAAVKVDDVDPEEGKQEEQTKVDPPPAKKLKRSQPVSYASADIEAFFLSPKTTAPDVQNPGIKFVTICHLKCT